MNRVTTSSTSRENSSSTSLNLAAAGGGGKAGALGSRRAARPLMRLMAGLAIAAFPVGLIASASALSEGDTDSGKASLVFGYSDKEQLCSDGLDNDDDGLIDGADPDCQPPADTDGDGFSDKKEQWLGSDPNNAASTPEHRYVDGTCSDGLDNDADSLVDSNDSGCQPTFNFFDFFTFFTFGSHDVCTDGKDNDGDGLIDGEDPNCQPPADTDGDGFSDKKEQWLGSDPNNAASTPEHRYLDETCTDGLDNDADGLVDANDPGCEPLTADTDGDGFSDKKEQWLGSDPNNAVSTPEHRYLDGTCTDGLDNDADGLVDANDSGCQSFMADSDKDSWGGWGSDTDSSSGSWDGWGNDTDSSSGSWDGWGNDTDSSSGSWGDWGSDTDSSSGSRGDWGSDTDSSSGSWGDGGSWGGSSGGWGGGSGGWGGSGN